MQKINPAQAASLEQDCKNSHFPTLPSMIRSQKHANESYLPFDSGSLPVSSPVSSPTRSSPKLQPSSSSHHHNLNAARSASFTSTGSASTFEEEDEEDRSLAERARRVGGIRGVRGEGDHLSITFTGGAGSRAGVRGLNALNVPSHLSLAHTSSYPRMALSLPHALGADGQSMYSLGNNNHHEAPLRSNSGMNSHSLSDINNDPDRSISLPTALPSYHWSSHHQAAEYQDNSTSTTNSSNSVSSVDNVFIRNINQYAGIPISSRQLQTFEMQQQRYLTEKYQHPPPPHSHPQGAPLYHHPHPALGSIFSQSDPVSDIRIDDIHISLPNLEDSLDNTIPFPLTGPPPPTNYSPNMITYARGVGKHSPGASCGDHGISNSRRSFITEPPIDITIHTNQAPH
jgi:hypothetical protein